MQNHIVMRNLVLSCALLGAFQQGMAQITLVNTSSEPLHPVTTLSDGMKYITYFPGWAEVGGTRTIRNLDLSFHRTLDYPAPPSGRVWSTMAYVTDALFDTDASTIEFVLVAMDLEPPNATAVHVFREDGTQLFVQDPGALVNISGADGGSAPIFTTPDGTFMAIASAIPFLPPVKIYELAGSLPCRDCFGAPQSSSVIGVPEQVAIQPSSITAFHDAVSQVVQVSLNGIDGDEAGLWDTSGRAVRVVRVQSGSPVAIDVAGLARGAYVVTVRAKGYPTGSVPVIVH